MQFGLFRHKGQIYDPSHLNDFIFPYHFGFAIYRIRVSFSCHCFTKALDNTPYHLQYKHGKESREFCFDRFELSKMLPNLIRTLGNVTFYESQKRDYLIIKLNDDFAPSQHYTIFFNFEKTGNKESDITIYVNSAYIKENEIVDAPAIKFNSLLLHILNGKIPPRGKRQKIIYIQK